MDRNLGAVYSGKIPDSFRQRKKQLSCMDFNINGDVKTRFLLQEMVLIQC